MNKQTILAEIKRTAVENGGIALGREKFQKITGIKTASWSGKYWRSWGDALKEAGFSENKFNEALDKETLIVSLIKLAKKNGKFPSEVDLKLEKTVDSNFPSHSTFRNNLGSQSSRIDIVRKYILENEEYKDALSFLPEQKISLEVEDTPSISNSSLKEGFVYLGMLKIDNKKRYKIGKTNLVERRSTELSLQLPEKLELLHSIRTDDMSGIEAYWHKRFAEKNTNGEWFDLSADDVRAFKKRNLM